MKTLVIAVLAGAMLAGLAACSPSRSPASTAGAAPPPVSHTVFAPYVNDVNKAKHVQSIVNAQKQALDRAINSQTGVASTTPVPAASTP